MKCSSKVLSSSRICSPNPVASGSLPHLLTNCLRITEPIPAVLHKRASATSIASSAIVWTIFEDALRAIMLLPAEQCPVREIYSDCTSFLVEARWGCKAGIGVSGCLVVEWFL